MNDHLRISKTQLSNDEFDAEKASDNTRALLKRVTSSGAFGRLAHASLMEFEKPYSRKPLKDVLPERLWAPIAHMADFDPKKGAEALALECATVRFACIFAQEQYGISSPHLDRSIHFEERIKDVLQAYVRKQREKGKY